MDLDKAQDVCSPMTKNIIIGERGGVTGGICSRKTK